MAFIPVPNGIGLCFHFTTGGQKWQFCITLKKASGAPSPADLASITSAAQTWFAAQLAHHVTAQTTLDNIVATDLTTQGGPQDTLVSGTAGSAAAGLVPLGSPIVVSLRTAKRGRSYRGRVYLSGYPQSYLASTVEINPTNAATLGNDIGLLGAAMGALGFDHIVASKQHNNVTTSPAATNLVTAYVTDTFIDSQRRRLAGRGT